MRKRLFGSVFSALLVSAAGTCWADETGFEIGGRLGYGIPFGLAGRADAPEDQPNPEQDLRLDDVASGMLPFGLDLGARVTPELMIGGYLQLGVGFVSESSADSCDAPGVDCSIFDVRVGVQLQYHPLPFQDLDPWFGAGFGYEWLTFSSSSGGIDSSIRFHGFEFVNLQTGLDFKIGQSSGIGPFASFSLGQYDTVSVSFSDEEGSDEIENKALHEWLVLGVRGTFVL